MTLDEFLDEWHRHANEYGARLTSEQREIAEQAWEIATAQERERCEWAEDCAKVLLRLKDTLAENGARPTTPDKAELWDAAFAIYERMLRWENPRSNRRTNDGPYTVQNG